jgi:hypothetical protein
MLLAVFVPRRRGENARNAGRTRMVSFAWSKIGLGLAISLVLVRLAAAFGTTSGIMLIAAIAIALFATAVFQTLTK